MYIYKTTNIINGKIYIGKTMIDSDEYIGSGKLLKKAIKKYGIQNFKKEILSECKTLSELNQKEKYFISLFQSQNPEIGYNISDGGDGGPLFEGHKHTDESRNKMSKSQKNRIEKNGHNMTGFQFGDESKKKMSENKKGKMCGSDNPMFGKKHTLKSRQKMSRPQYGSDNGMFGKHHTNATKEKISKKMLGENNPFYGKKHSDETKERIRKSRMGKYYGKTNSLIIDNIEYISVSHASKILGINSATIRYRAISKSEKFKNYFFLDKTESK